MNRINDLAEISRIDSYELISKMGITKAPIDVFELARNLPIITNSSFDMEKLSFSGEIFFDKQEHKPVIWINPLDAKTRQRFTMAHEIAHLINDVIPKLHEKNHEFIRFDDDANKLRRDGRQDPVEFKANEFAAQLLMPADFVIKETKEIIKSYKNQNGVDKKISIDDLVIKLASIFEVSQQAMKIRLSRIGIG